MNDQVEIIGVKDGKEHHLGTMRMPPRMKARQIAIGQFGHFEDGDGSDAELCFGALEQLIDYMLEAQQPAGDEGMYLLQDTRSYVGNCVVWWAKDGNGYTTDVDKAHRYTFDEAMRQHRSRDTDLPWSCDEVVPLARGRVDVQDVHMIRSLGDQRAALASSERKGE